MTSLQARLRSSPPAPLHNEGVWCYINSAMHLFAHQPGVHVWALELRRRLVDVALSRWQDILLWNVSLDVLGMHEANERYSLLVPGVLDEVMRLQRLDPSAPRVRPRAAFSAFRQDDSPDFFLWLMDSCYAADRTKALVSCFGICASLLCRDPDTVPIILFAGKACLLFS
jgi:uncharacterized UBP type Zn finger protein